jgi:hypothetical protein
VVVLVAVLTWVSMRTFNLGGETLDLARGELDRFNSIEADLHANILSARAGLLHNYDPLVRDTDAPEQSTQRMRASMAGDPSTEAMIDRLNVFARRQEELTEEFKSNNTLLQNSLAYFALLSAHLSAPDQDDPLAPEVSELAVAMLHLTLDTGPASVAAVQNRLDDLARRVHTAVEISPDAGVLAHGRLLYELLPKTDRLLKELDELSRMRSQDAEQTRLLMREHELRTRTLRRRAAFEHVLSGISMRFVAAHGSDLDSVVGQALGEMAACLGAHRAYFVAYSAAKQTITWHPPGIPFPPRWPDGALGLLRQHSYPARNRVVHVPNIARLAPGAAKDALATVGLTGLA